MIKTLGTCSPKGIKNYEKYHTCLSLSELRTLAMVYNKIVKMAKDPQKEPDLHKKIVMKEIPCAKFKTVSSLYKELNQRFLKICQPYKDNCWIDQPFIQKELKDDVKENIENNFRPLMQSSWIHNKRELLDTFDILKVMKQYEDAHKNFLFLGVFPSDFMQEKDNDKCLISDICHFKLENILKAKKKHMGFVMNLDPHYKGGSHWVCVYINLDPTDIRYGYYYYDSYGLKEPKPIRLFYDTLQTQWKEWQKKTNNNYKDLPFYRNKIRHQFQNTECGMFSIITLVMCLENNVPIKQIMEKMLKPKSDDMIAEFRDKLFRKHNI